MNIAFVTSNYPTPACPATGTFVQQFVWAMARQGHACTVIHPIRWAERRHGPLPSRQGGEAAGEEHRVQILRPRYLSYSSRRIGWIHTGRWSNSSFASAVQRAMRRLRATPDVVYGHFMYPSSHAAILAAKDRALSVVGVGEGEFWTLEPVGLTQAIQDMQEASAFLAVSTPISESLTRTLQISRDKIRVFPNGVALDRFHPVEDREAMCRRLGLPADTFNVGFMGPCIPAKGYPQLKKAVQGLEDIRLVVLARGALPPMDHQIAFSGSVPHAMVPDYLATCHVFVLPTRIEGSCNAILEAMACGVPIVTSNGRFMDDIVDEQTAIRVDPNDSGGIREAILMLQHDPARRVRMSAACREKARTFNIDERAKRVGIWWAELLKDRHP